MKKLLTIYLLIAFFFKAEAQITDSIFVTTPVKPYLYTSLPSGNMMNTKGKEVDFIEYIRKERLYKDKPTLFITWSDVFCVPCSRLIDSIIAKDLTRTFNLVLVNKDKEIGIEKITTLLNKHPAFNQKALSLFDTYNILKSIDEGIAPMMFWMDKDLNIAGAFMGYAITANKIEELLVQVANKTLQPFGLNTKTKRFILLTQRMQFLARK
jgi:hypothetical protein